MADSRTPCDDSNASPSQKEPTSSSSSSSAANTIPNSNAGTELNANNKPVPPSHQTATSIPASTAPTTRITSLPPPPSRPSSAPASAYKSQSPSAFKPVGMSDLPPTTSSSSSSFSMVPTNSSSSVSAPRVSWGSIPSNSNAGINASASGTNAGSNRVGSGTSGAGGGAVSTSDDIAFDSIPDMSMSMTSASGASPYHKDLKNSTFGGSFTRISTTAVSGHSERSDRVGSFGSTNSGFGGASGQHSHSQPQQHAHQQHLAGQSHSHQYSRDSSSAALEMATAQPSVIAPLEMESSFTSVRSSAVLDLGRPGIGNNISVASSANEWSRSSGSGESDEPGIFMIAENQEHVGLHTKCIRASEDIFNCKDPKIKEDIVRMIAQYLGDEGFAATKLTMLDEANVKWHEREEQQQDIKRIKKAIMDGDWPEVDRLCSKTVIKNQKSFLYAVYRQQYLEYIEHHEIQKAFTHLNKRLKPLEHLATTAQEFRDICYLLTAKSVHDAPSFRSWEGIGPSREKLVELFQTMVDVELADRDGSAYIPPDRLLTMLRQAVAYQIEFSRYHPRIAPKIKTLLQDYQSLIIPNAVRHSFVGHRGNVKCVDFVGDLGQYIISGSSDNTCRIWETDTAECRAVLEGHSARIWDVSSNRAGTFVASASGDSTVK
ncbi:hypothetical protein HDU76_007166, partial [Blyttiomyces sp. JEL0837]